MDFLRRLADNTNASSLATKLRRKRFRIFEELISSVKRRPLRILDVGGTLNFWRTMRFVFDKHQVELTVLNLSKSDTPSPGITTVVGDARNMSRFHDGCFDLVFSNSVIEHVGDFRDQRNMAREIRRLGNGYFVQTPNRYFPLEPHFLFPFFQFLPLHVSTLLVKNFRIGWHGPTHDSHKARNAVVSIRLLGKTRFGSLFPDARLYEERLIGLAKSFVAVRPWSASRLPAGCSPSTAGAKPLGPPMRPQEET
jgi:hypothetical protein